MKFVNIENTQGNTMFINIAHIVAFRPGESEGITIVHTVESEEPFHVSTSVTDIKNRIDRVSRD
jgi:hypothetical protein